jgi:hypothetical protein
MIKKLLFSLLFTAAATAQAPAIDWKKALGGTNAEEAYCIQQTADGGYIVAGNTKSYDGDVVGNHGGYSDAWIVKISGAGELQWQKSLGGTGEDAAYSIGLTSDGGYIVGGFTTSTDGDIVANHGQFDAWVIKLSSSGDIEWQKTIGGTSDEWIKSIQQTADGGYVFAGYAHSISGDIPTYIGNTEAWVMKLSATGTIEWQKALGGVAYDRLYHIRQTADGGYVTVGFTNSLHADGLETYGDYDGCVTKLSASGIIQWQKGLGGTADDYAFDVQQTSDNGYIVAGSTESNDFQVSGNHGYEDAWIVKLSGTGELQWQKTFGGTDDDRPYCIRQISDGNYIFAGQTWSADGDITLNQGWTDGWIVKISDSGSLLWQKTIGSYGIDTIQDIKPTDDGRYIVAGYANSFDGDVAGNHGSYDAWVVKLDSEMATATFDNRQLKVFPNPVQSILQLQAPNGVSMDAITIIDMEGKTVLEQSSTSNQVNVAKLASGTYIVQINSEGKIYKEKFIKE